MLDIKSIKQNYDLVMTLTRSLMKSRYRKTIAGFLWVILNPILTFVVQALIFKNILKINVDNYYLFLLAGVVPWIFITSTMNMTVSMFVSNRQNLMAFKISPWIFIASQVVDNSITFFVSFVILLTLNASLSTMTGFQLPLFLFASAIFTIAVYYISFLLAILHVFLRDTQFVLQFVLNLAFFATPIFYPITLLPENIRWVAEYNPLYILIKPFQSIFWKYDLNLFFHDMTKTCALTILVTALCLWYWSKKKYDIYFRI